jgi:hypothetical protein
MRTPAAILVLTLVLLAGAGVLYTFIDDTQITPVQTPLGLVSKMVLCRYNHNDRETQVTLTDRKAIAPFFEGFELKKKLPCACEHIDSVEIYFVSSPMRKISICDHCFGNDHEMPKHFYDCYSNRFSTGAFWQKCGIYWIAVIAAVLLLGGIAYARCKRSPTTNKGQESSGDMNEEGSR